MMKMTLVYYLLVIGVLISVILNVAYSQDLLNRIGYQECGKIDETFIENDVYFSRDSVNLKRGEWPWLAAIFEREGNESIFRCVATRYSYVAVVTTAECLQKSPGVNLNVSNIEIYMGQDNLNNRASNMTDYASAIHIHPDYKPEVSRIDNNIAIITLQKVIRYSEFVGGACLPIVVDFNDETGFVAGWNMSPGKADPVLIYNFINSSNCFNASSTGGAVTPHNNETFCAGDDIYEGPCFTKQGSAFMVRKYNTWILRGIALSGVGNSESFCKSDAFFTYLDIRKYAVWLSATQHEAVFAYISKIFSFLNVNIFRHISPPNCGVISDKFESQPLVFGGTEIPRGSWPWMAAIFRFKDGKSTFICSGTLISQKVVLSAAHCFAARNNSFLTKDDVKLYLGRYNIEDNSEPGSQLIALENIITHPDYHTGSADIAMMIFAEQVELTEYIHTACIWNLDVDFEGMDVFVAGWGRYGHSDEEKMRKTPFGVGTKIVSNAECVRSNAAFQVLSSNRTMCAGNLDGTGPCQGDSGGGLFFRTPRGIWFLRGIVSVSLASEVEYCDLKNYVVYSDVSKHLQWIKDNIVY